MDNLDKKWVRIIIVVFIGCFLVGEILTYVLKIIIPNGLDLTKGMITPILMILGLLAVLYKYSRDKYDH